jgi:phage recombination protein Bet
MQPMKKKTRQRKRQPRRKSKRQSPQQAMVVYRQGKQVELNDHQVNLIRNLCAKDATEQEFELFMTICKKSRMDPFKKEIYFVKFNTKRGPQMVIITGIDGFRSMAARDHRDYGGTSDAVFTWTDKKTPAGKLIPATATVTAKRLGGITNTATAYWEEFAPADLHAERSDFWNRMPKVMLEKCAEARALRKTFPSLGNIFTTEEMYQAMQDYSPEGRQISTDGVAPSGAIVDEHAAAKARQKQILDEKLGHGHLPGTVAAKNAEASLERVQAEDAKLAEMKKANAKRIDEPKPKKLPFDDCILWNGTIHRVVQSKAQNGALVLDIQINKDHFKCFHRSLFNRFLDFGKLGGFTVSAYIHKTRKTIEGLKKIGPVSYMEDGKTEIPPGREPGDE